MSKVKYVTLALTFIIGFINCAYAEKCKPYGCVQPKEIHIKDLDKKYIEPIEVYNLSENITVSSVNTNVISSNKYINKYITYDMFEAIIPNNYWTVDYPDRDNSPLNKFRRGNYKRDGNHILNIERNYYDTSLKETASNFILDMLMGSITNNMFYLNVLQSGIDGAANGFEATVKPYKLLSFTYSYFIKDINTDIQTFEVKLKNSKINNLVFKTAVSTKAQAQSDNITGLELQLAF